MTAHTSWADRLRLLVEEGLDDLTPEAVAQALTAEATRVLATGDGAPEPLLPDVPVLGVTGCATGWVGVLLTPAGRSTVHVSARIGSLVEQVRESVEIELMAFDLSTATPERAEEVAHWLRLRPGIEVFETRPDASLAQRDALTRAGLAVPGWFAGSGFEEDDLLAACALVRAAVQDLEAGV